MDVLVVSLRKTQFVTDGYGAFGGRSDVQQPRQQDTTEYAQRADQAGFCACFLTMSMASSSDCS
ncbi:hypothetical protein D3C83_81260 [compost metagenome]